MGESTDQTRDEIVQLRQSMSQKIADVKRAAERPLRIAKVAAVGAAVVIVAGTATIIILRARRRREERTLVGRAKAIVKAAEHPQDTARNVQKAAEKAVHDAREKMREELRKELANEVKDARPLHERILTTAAQSAASAAIPIVMRKLQERAEAPSRK